MISQMFKTPPVDGMKIGLFGGSFNPAHDGHVALANFALNRLQLDYVWWMVSPQNPLKPVDETKDFSERLARVKQLARHPRFVVTDIEKHLATTNTAQTLAALAPVLERGKFVWLMGADSFAGLHRWNNWQTIPATLPIAVFDRPGWTTLSLASTAAKSLKQSQLRENEIAALPWHQPPAWGFVAMPQRSESSTAIRHKKHV